jgi:DNA-binding NtrC family response regulator
LDTFPPVQKFLIIDENRDSAELLSRSLRRKFPVAALRCCDEASTAEKWVAAGGWQAVVVHRAYDADAVTLVRALRQIDAHLPIVVVSGIDRSEAVLAAGATGFITLDQWLLLGPTMVNVLNPPSSAPA